MNFLLKEEIKEIEDLSKNVRKKQDHTSLRPFPFSWFLVKNVFQTFLQVKYHCFVDFDNFIIE